MLLHVAFVSYSAEKNSVCIPQFYYMYIYIKVGCVYIFDGNVMLMFHIDTIQERNDTKHHIQFDPVRVKTNNLGSDQV